MDSKAFVSCTVTSCLGLLFCSIIISTLRNQKKCIVMLRGTTESTNTYSTCLNLPCVFIYRTCTSITPIFSAHVRIHNLLESLSEFDGSTLKEIQSYQTSPDINSESWTPSLSSSGWSLINSQCKGVYLDVTPLSMVPWSTPLNYTMSWLSFWQGLYPLMRWRSKSVWGQTKESHRSEKDNSEERERAMEMAINETRPPSVSAARLGHTLLFNEKRGDKKENFSSAEITQMWWRRTRGRKCWTRLSNFYIYFLDCLLLAESHHHLRKNKRNTLKRRHISSRSLSNPIMLVIVKCRSWGSAGLSPSLCVVHPGGLWHKRFDFSLTRPQLWYDQ